MSKTYDVLSNETDEFDLYYDNEFLEMLLACRIDEDTAAYGITKCVIDQGLESLNDNQLKVFKKYVMKPYETLNCPVCGEKSEGYEKQAILCTGYCTFHSRLQKQE